MSLASTLRFIVEHPLNKGHPVPAVWRFLRWQVESRLKEEVVFDWIAGAKLAVRNGMTGATGNVYCGLHEYADMAFALHLLRPGDLFVDVGANIGSYTILATKVCGARSIAVEPDPHTSTALRRNVELNACTNHVEVAETALGSEVGRIAFTVGRDTVNKVASADASEVQEVPITTLDKLVDGRIPALIKIDVEGFEPEVIKGAVKTLSEPNMLAIETERTDGGVTETLLSHGYVQRYYDPHRRRLVSEPVMPMTNGLFVREVETVAERLAEAPIRSFRGCLL